ncbi:MAG: glycosyltransferase [Alsobacter sp.]
MSGRAGPALSLVRPAPGRILVVVTHLLGIGHLSRAALLARALAREGHAVTLVSGGTPSPLTALEGVALVQLPPVRCVGTDFRNLLDEAGAPVTAERLARRRERLLAAFDEVGPDVVITELFPFGRRQLAEEFDTLLERARTRRPRPAVLASVRDILNPPSRTSRVSEALRRLGRSYDRVLVHGDPAVSRLWDSWPCAPSLAARLVDTGLVADRDRQAAPPAVDPVASGDVLVSGGGSAAALPLFEASLGAARLTPERRWRILVGHGVAEAAFQALREDAPANAAVERARADFPALLARAAVSVSQCGYNTMADVALARVRSVVVPFEEGGEREQGLRAGRLEAAGLVDRLGADRLTGETLARAVRAALARPRPPLADPRRPALQRVSLDTDGAAASAAAVAQALQRSRSRERARSRAEAALDACGRLDVWWRDDDAVEDSPALQRLLALAASHGASPALAVIPATAEASLAEALAGHPDVAVLQHGFAHANHAPDGQKKMELVVQAPAALVLTELETGLRRLRRLFGARALPVLVPPWNRIDPALLPLLPEVGFEGLSTFRARPRREAAPGLLAVNTHLDPIAWRQGGGLREPADLWDDLADQLEARAGGRADAGEPLGLLTHHLVHDEWVWAFLEDLLSLFAAHPSVHWRTAQVVFAGQNGGKPDG